MSSSIASTPGNLEFESHRPRLLGLAYRMLGSMAEAEDVVQEAYLRWQRVDRARVRSSAAMLNTVTTRLCLDQLRSARARRTHYVGAWLPEPVATNAQLDDGSISMALLVVLERLTPAQRAVYVLRQVFEYEFAEIAEMTGTSEANCRQLLRRAREHIRRERPRFAASREQHRRLVDSFLRACRSGDLEGLRGLLADDVRLTSDGGGRVKAITRPLVGARPVARMFANLLPRVLERATAAVEEINGAPAIVVRVDGVVDTVLSFTVEDEAIVAIWGLRNPDKLGRVSTPTRMQ